MRWLSSASGIALMSAGGVVPRLSLTFNSPTLDSRITFSRPSLATYFDSTGKLTYCPNQLFLQRGTPSSASWAKSSISVSGNTLTLTGATATKYISQAPGSTSFYNVIVWFDVSAGTHSFLQIVGSTGTQSYANFNISNGTVGTKGPNSPYSGVVDLGGGSFRIWAKFSSSAFATQFRLYAVDSSSASYASSTSSTGTFTFFGSGCSAVTYETSIRTVDQVVTTSSAYYGPRIGYNPSTLALRGLLVEEARTNLLTYSQAFDNAAWTESGIGVIAAGSVTGPDDRTSGQTITASAGGTEHRVYHSSTTITSGTTYAYSVYAKKNTNSYIAVGLQGTSGANEYITAVFDLDGVGSTATQTSVGSTSGTIVSTSITSIGGGWYRLELVGSLVEPSCYPWVGHANAATGNTIDTFGIVTFSAVGTKSFYVFGAQLEAGSFATSYIPTGSAAVARSADSVTMTGSNFSSWYNASEGTFVAEAETFELGSSNYMFAVNDGTNNERTLLDVNSATPLLFVSDGGATQANLSTANTASKNTRFKLAGAYKANDFGICLNGGVVATDTSGTLPTVDRLAIAANNISANGYLNGHIKSLKYYNRRLPDATLQSLTT